MLEAEGGIDSFSNPREKRDFLEEIDETSDYALQALELEMASDE